MLVKGANNVAVSELGCRKALVGTGKVTSVMFGTLETSHLTLIKGLHFH